MYQPEKQETRITGRITDRGPSAVDAVGTPLGKYQEAGLRRDRRAAGIIT